MNWFGPDIRSILNQPVFYRMLKKVSGCRKNRANYVKEYLRPKESDKVLDIGCGTADILEYLPSVAYVGFDINLYYINWAREKYGHRGLFICRKVGKDIVDEFSNFDLVMANGVIHHLADAEAEELFITARMALKPSGRFVAIDPCFIERQSLITRCIFSLDRGHFIRNREQYKRLASLVFPVVKETIRQDISRLPFTHIIMECTL